MTTKTWNGSNADWYTNNGGDWSPPGRPRLRRRCRHQQRGSPSS